MPLRSAVTVQGSVFSFPSQVHSSGRYVLSQAGSPWFMLSDQLLPGLHNGSFSDIAQVLTDRATRGFNAIWLCLTPDEYIGAVSGLTDNAGNPAFDSSLNYGSPNVAYWANVDAVIALAATLGITMLLMPVQTGTPGGSISTARTNGTTLCTTFGTFLGNRYKTKPNIVWCHGNDFGNNSSWIGGTPPSQSDDTLMENIANGIKAAGDTHLQTMQLNFNRSLSTDDSSSGGWRTLSDLNLAYSYYQTYDVVLQGYLAKNSDASAAGYSTRPVFMGEANYEGMANQGGTNAGNYVLRAQNYWSGLCGAFGQVWGNGTLHHFSAGWQAALSSTGAVQAGYWARFFRALPWWTLVPDSANTFLTAQSVGTYNGGATVLTVTVSGWATGAVTADGSLGVVYTPVAQTLTIDMTKMRGTTAASWYDPANNTWTPIGSFANTGTHGFVASGTNADGDPDKVLVLTA
jgi:hypothetical protein